jgi:predicted acylesterase/phospholipase RssA
MAHTHTKTAIAFQGGGALGAFALGALRYIYETEPGFRPSCVSGVSIGAFTAAIVASHPGDPISQLEAFWDELTVFHSSLLPPETEKYLAIFGNRAFYRPRFDYFTLPSWTSFYSIDPISRTLSRYVDFAAIAQVDVKLVVTATDIVSGRIAYFRNTDRDRPLAMEHLIASGSLPPSYPPKQIDKQFFWDGGLFDNTPLSALLDLIDARDAATTRVIVVNLFPDTGAVPKNMLDVWDRMTELQFANKTAKDVKLAQTINKLVALIEELQSKAEGGPQSVLDRPEFSELAKYKAFDNIIPIANTVPEPVSSSCDFSKASIQRRIQAGYEAAAAALAHPPMSLSDLKAAI